MLKIIEKIKQLFKRNKPQKLHSFKELHPEAKTLTITRPHSRTTYDLEKGTVRKSFKPRTAHEKRMWGNKKRMPQNIKDEDEE
jgi:hypothetical protein